MPNPSRATKEGSIAAILVTVLTAITFLLAILTPPLSGPFCQAGCYTYPYADVAARFPRDYLWMFPAIPLFVVVLFLFGSIHDLAQSDNKVFSRFALACATISSGTLILDYFVQLTVMQPSLLLGEHDGLALLSQYNPHGLFIALEEIGYVLLSVALLSTVPVFAKTTRAQRVLRWIFMSNFLLGLGALALISVFYGLHREYRFEVATITLNFLTLIIAGPLLAQVFKDTGRVA